MIFAFVFSSVFTIFKKNNFINILVFFVSFTPGLEDKFLLKDYSLTHSSRFYFSKFSLCIPLLCLKGVKQFFYLPFFRLVHKIHTFLGILCLMLSFLSETS